MTKSGVSVFKTDSDNIQIKNTHFSRSDGFDERIVVQRADCNDLLQQLHKVLEVRNEVFLLIYIGTTKEAGGRPLKSST